MAATGDAIQSQQVIVTPGTTPISPPALGAPLLYVKPTVAAPTSTSVGGALLLENTQNTGAGLIIYTNSAGNGLSTGRLMNLRVQNATFPAPALHVDYAGSGNGVEIVSTSTSSNANAFSVQSFNPNDTAAGISGYEKDKGTLKLTHENPGPGRTADANAAVISIMLKAPAGSLSDGTSVQGIHIDTDPDQGTVNATGRLLNIRNNNADRLLLEASGQLTAQGMVIARGGLCAPVVVGSVSVPPTANGKMRIYNEQGTTIGYVPIFTTL